MKLTVVHNADGTIGGIAQKVNQVRQPFDAGLVAGPGQKLQEVEVPDDFAQMKNGAEFHKRVQEHLKRK